MPDPTLTRYSLGPAPVLYRKGEIQFVDAEVEIYLCEEADRLIQALREELETKELVIIPLTKHRVIC